MLPPDQIEEVQSLCSEAKAMSEAGQAYLLLPALRLPPGSNPAVVDALLSPKGQGGYTTRMFVSAQVSGKGANWTSHRILDRVWYTPSWKNVGAELRLLEMIIGHLEVYR
jgi:hypothetical protein